MKKQTSVRISVAFALALLACGSLSAAQTLYKNTFNQRTSQSPVPSPDWMTVSYTAGLPLYNNYTNTTSSAIAVDKLYASPAQDNWSKVDRGNVTAQRLCCHVSADANPCGVFSSESEVPLDMARHPLRNRISAGLVRYSFDLRTPSGKKSPGTDGVCRVRLEYGLMMRDDEAKIVWADQGTYPVSVGYAIRVNDTTKAVYIQPDIQCKEGLKRIDQKSAGAAGLAFSSWYRYVVTIDVGTSKIRNVQLYSLGTASPTFETDGTFLCERGKSESLSFTKALDVSAYGPIEGISIYSQASGTGKYYGESGFEDEYAHKFDNLKVEWKPSEADEWMSIYENDFATCRRKTLPAINGTATSCDYVKGSHALTNACDYPAALVRAASDYSADVAVSMLADAVTGQANQPVGYDSWRRVNPTGKAQMFLVENEGNRAAGMLYKQSAFSFAVQPIGEEITSGKVKAEFDVRVPDAIDYAKNGAAHLCFVPGSMWDDYQEDPSMTGYFFFGGGIYSATSGAAIQPAYRTAGSSLVPTSAPDLKARTWYRVRLIADLDPVSGYQKFNYYIYEIGAAQPTFETVIDYASPIISKAGLNMPKTFVTGGVTKNMINNGVATVGAVAFCNYSVSSKIDNTPLFDNIRVWKDYDASTDTGTLVYSNDFTTRTRIVEGAGVSLTSAKHDRMFEGLDCWSLINGNGRADVLLAGDADNQCVSLNANNALAYVVQSIGGSYRRKGTVVRVDFRPPLNWRQTSSAWMSIGFANDQFLSGTYCGSASTDGNYFYNGRFFELNLSPVGNLTAAQVTTNTLCTVVGAASKQLVNDIDPSHWYRLRARLDFVRKTYDVDLYDMGVEHPEWGTADGTKVKSYSDLAFRATACETDAKNRLSAVYMRIASNSSTLPWKKDDPYAGLVDNIGVERDSPGLCIIFR